MVSLRDALDKLRKEAYTLKKIDDPDTAREIDSYIQRGSMRGHQTPESYVLSQMGKYLKDIADLLYIGDDTRVEEVYRSIVRLKESAKKRRGGVLVDEVRPNERDDLVNKIEELYKDVIEPAIEAYNLGKTPTILTNDTEEPKEEDRKIVTILLLLLVPTLLFFTFSFDYSGMAVGPYFLSFNTAIGFLSGIIFCLIVYFFKFKK